MTIVQIEFHIFIRLDGYGQPTNRFAPIFNDLKFCMGEKLLIRMVLGCKLELEKCLGFCSVPTEVCQLCLAYADVEPQQEVFVVISLRAQDYLAGV